MTTEPLEKCPICDGVVTTIYRWSDNTPVQADYICGARWKSEQGNNLTPWFRLCKFAMTAAERCGATLHPTAREQARDALVEAAVNVDLELESQARVIHAAFDYQLAAMIAERKLLP